MAKAWVGWALSAAVTAGSAVDTRESSRKARHSAEDRFEQQEEAAQAAADEAKAAELKAEADAEEKRRKRALSLSTGGRSSTFTTGPLGVTGDAVVGKKTLFGA